VASVVAMMPVPYKVGPLFGSEIVKISVTVMSPSYLDIVVVIVFPLITLVYPPKYLFLLSCLGYRVLMPRYLMDLMLLQIKPALIEKLTLFFENSSF